MGKIERIFESIRLFDRFDDLFSVHYEIPRDRFDVIGTRFFLHMDEENDLHFWFSTFQPKKPIPGKPETNNKREEFLFPAQHVFVFLDIDYSAIPAWRPEYLHEIAGVLRDNAVALRRAFSMENNDKTVSALLAMRNYDPEKIKRIRNRIRGYN